SATSDAIAAVSDEPALRRTALVALRETAGRVAMDGKPLVALGRQRGEILEIDVPVPVLPLSQSSALEAAVAPLGRHAIYVSGALALGSLAAQNGVDHAVVVSLGREVTDVCVVRDGAPAGARSFSVGSASLESRPHEAAASDLAVWARCAVLAASAAAGALQLPSRAILSASPSSAPALESALRDALAARLPAGDTTIALLEPSALPRLASDVPLESPDLIAVAAGSL
ncbi:MAG TPA: hypothetical protein VJQ09_05870, partial [Candidatus Limnocylindria bacterium]|nr:hypothetical protein [Candidatus Limnocylindria bacterium]